MRARVKHLMVAAAAASALVLGGCASPNTAATVDGDTLTVAEAEARAERIGQVLGTRVNPADVVGLTVEGTIAREVADRAGVRVPEDQIPLLLAQQGVPQGVINNPDTGSLLRGNAYAQIVSGQVAPQDYARIARDIPVTINPRFGRVDPSGHVVKNGSLSLLSPQTIVKLQQLQTQEIARQQELAQQRGN